LQTDDVSGYFAKRGSWSWCGSSCIRYHATIKNTSNSVNKVWVGAHTWRKRSYPNTKKCADAFADDGTKHSIYKKGDSKVYAFQEGERWVPSITLQPNQSQKYIIELDLSRLNMTKDWSVTAWGENGSVQIEIDELKNYATSD